MAWLVISVSFDYRGLIDFRRQILTSNTDLRAEKVKKRAIVGLLLVIFHW